jgi:hypothetical protein
MKNSLLFLLSLVFFQLHAQEVLEYSFSFLRQNDIISSLDNKKDKNTYEQFKWLGIGNYGSISFGGSNRFQAESFKNQFFLDEEEQDNFWMLNRIQFHTHLKLGKALTFFAELNSSTIIDKDELSPVDKDVLSFNQLFVKYNFNDHWSIGTGRENLQFGSNRLIDIREGTNVRRSFDFFRVNFENEKMKVTGFLAIPVQPKPQVFDNKGLEFSETLTGIYATMHFSERVNFDFYTLYQKDNNVTYEIGTEDEHRGTIGTRFFGSLNDFTFNTEAVYQLGSFGNYDISAWTVSLQIEHAIYGLGDKEKFGLKTEIISGDKNGNDDILNTFDALYPRGSYFGRVARFGPSNLIDIHPYINAQFKKLFVEFDYDVFWRYSINDGVYNAALLLEYPNTNNKRFIGQQLGTIVGYKIDKHIYLEFESNIVFPGAFLKQSNQGDILYHFVFTTEIKF